METCETCRFGLLGVQGNPDHGICRRHPPTDKNRWPEVMNYDWCGEYSLIPPKGTSHD